MVFAQSAPFSLDFGGFSDALSVGKSSLPQTDKAVYGWHVGCPQPSASVEPAVAGSLSPLIHMVPIGNAFKVAHTSAFLRHPQPNSGETHPLAAGRQPQPASHPWIPHGPNTDMGE